MTFVNLSLLAGTALIAVPIILHLIMRRKPMLLEFPALRFIEQRHDVNRRRLRLRHLLLLLLRAGAIALLAFALARPSVNFGTVVGSQEAPVAAALVFDAAPRMEYRHENKTRFEAARDLGLWLLKQLPEQSEIAVVDTQIGSGGAFQPDRGAAKDRIVGLTSVANSQPLPVAIEAAAKLLQESKKQRKEIYIFTDLSRGAWPEEQAAQLQRQLAELNGVGIYVIDVGVTKPTDYGLGEVHLSGEVLSNRSTLSVGTELSCVGLPAARSVELNMIGGDGKPHSAGVQSVEATPGELRPVQFHVAELEPGTHQGFLRIVGQDGLAANDTRYFTVEVKPAWRVLLAAPKPAENYALFLTEALAPESYRKSGQARFDCDVCELAELPKRQLADYAAVCVLDPTPMEPATWQKLVDFAAEGHGVAVFLGRNALPIDSFNEAHAQAILPGKLVREARRPDGDLHLAPRDFQHPILAPLRNQASSIPWDAFPVFRYWQFGAISKGVGIVAPYSDGRPAVLERSVGQGRAITMTTPVSDRPSQNPWNLLPIGGLGVEPWPFLILANQMAAYLVGSNDQQLNYLAGETAVLRLDAAQRRRGFLLFTPDGRSSSYPADLNRRELPITTTDQVGNYRLQAGGDGGVNLGFSVNYAPGQTRLDRLGDHELAAMFGPLKFQLAHTREQIDRDISTGRVGRELLSAADFDRGARSGIGDVGGQSVLSGVGEDHVPRSATSDRKSLIPAERIERSILLIRGQKVMLDNDLAMLYGVETKKLIQAVKRNIARFPDDFMFQLDDEEFKILRSQFVTSSYRGGRRYAPYAFTEQGVAMLSSVLRSPQAVAVNIEIMRAFVRLRRMLLSHAELARKVDLLEKKYDGQFKVVFDALRQLMQPLEKPKRPIGFHTKQ